MIVFAIRDREKISDFPTTSTNTSHEHDSYRYPFSR
jgi:hypothetical protein